MRRFICFALLVFSMMVIMAQQPTPLTLSSVTSLIRAKSPTKQLKSYDPLFARFKSVLSPVMPIEFNLSTIIGKSLKQYDSLPGVDADGEFWFFSVPGTPAPKPDDNKTPAVNETQPNPVEEKEEKDDKPGSVSVALVPVRDAQQLRNGLAAQGDEAEYIAQILDRYALLIPKGAIVQQYTDVKLDLPIVSKRDIVMISSPTKLPFIGEEEEADPGAEPAMFSFAPPFKPYLKQIGLNQQRIETGFAMVGDNLSIETFIIPVQNSPLAKRLATQKPATQGVDLAGYLPTNLSYCGSSGPMLEGIPGMGNIALRIPVALVSAFRAEERRSEIEKLWNDMSAVCSQGRALGITTPTEKAPTKATVLGVYHLANPKNDAAVIRKFMTRIFVNKEQINIRTLVRLPQKTTITYQQGKELQSNVPIDVLTIVAQPATPVKDEETGVTPPTPKPVKLECRLAFINDIFLLAVGGDSKTEMNAMIWRIKTNNKGFTTSKRFTELKSTLPAAYQGFQFCSPRDLSLSITALLPIEDVQKAVAMKWIGQLPIQQTTISSYSEFQQGCVRSEIIVPGEQFDFLCELATAGIREAMVRMKDSGDVDTTQVIEQLKGILQ